MKNTSDVISWFKNTSNKKQPSCGNFNVENAFPSISEKLLIDAINFAESSVNNAAKGILWLCRFTTWEKKPIAKENYIFTRNSKGSWQNVSAGINENINRAHISWWCTDCWKIAIQLLKSYIICWVITNYIWMGSIRSNYDFFVACCSGCKICI